MSRKDEKDDPEVSRRDYVKAAVGAAVGAVVGAAAGAAGMRAALPPIVTKEVEKVEVEKPVIVEKEVPVEVKPWLPEKWDDEADVIVVGYGAAGAAAAVEAYDAGADVLILEKLPTPGGDTILCGGAVYAAGTEIQKALGIDDSAEEMKKYYRQIKPGLNLPEFIDILAEKSSEAVEWLINNGAKIPARLGIPGLTIGGFEHLYEDVTPAKPRSHWVEGGGRGLFKAIQSAVQSRNIRVKLETPVERLIFDPVSNGVIGVKAKHAGKELLIKAKKAVILATGGWCHNKELLTAYAPCGNAYPGAKGSPGSTGDGIVMAQAVGAYLWAMHEILESLGIKEAPNAYFTPFMEYTIIVNKKAERFINEGAWTEPITEETLRQPGAVAFLIFDSAIRERSEVATTLESVIPDKYVIKDDTIRGLAEKLGLDPEALESTIEDYNTCCETGEDPFGKTKEQLIPIKVPPFYAIKADPLPVITTGGVLTNTRAQVLNAFKEPIKRLYAAGEVTGGKVVGYPGCGSSITECIVFGRIAGRNAALETPWE